MKTKLICLAAVCCWVLGVQLRADENGPLLPGHRENDRALVVSKLEILVGRFVLMPGPQGDATGSSYYEKTDVDVIRVLRGTVSAKIKASFTVVWVPSNERETVPTLGTAYIMFIRKASPREYEIEKLELATDKNVKSVEDLIAARDQLGSG